MTRDRPRNLPRSVHDRLLALAHQRQEDFQMVLTHYALERLLYRLSVSAHRDTFILKGAMLFALWTARRQRPTKDLDLLGRGEPSLERLAAIFREVCGQPVEEDGLVFHPETVHAGRIREDEEYEGARVQLQSRLGNARITLQIEVGFGDAITPGPETVVYPPMLPFPAAQVLAYPRETVVAEKFQAMVQLGVANSRLKDFYDVWLIAQQFAFTGPPLVAALTATFARRRTALPTAAPLALTAEYYADTPRGKQC
jgi:hypothetical protein